MMEEAWGRVWAMVAESGLIPSDANSWFVSAVIVSAAVVDDDDLRSPAAQNHRRECMYNVYH